MNTQANANAHSRNPQLQTLAEQEALQRMHPEKGASKFSGWLHGSSSECHTSNLDDLKFWLSNVAPSTAEQMEWSTLETKKKIVMELGEYKLELIKNE